MNRRARDLRRQILLRGLTACYEIIDMIRKELAELDADDRAALSHKEQSK